jgi:hypothetical protein
MCQACGSAPIDIHYGDAALCDRCFDARLAEEKGYPRLPDPPPPATLKGADGRSHRFRFRIWRTPGGVLAEAIEQGVRHGDGFYVTEHGSHDVDFDRLVTRLTVKLLRQLSSTQLKRSPSGWMVMGGDVVTGRFVWNERDGPYDVVIDGTTMTWEEFGHAVEPFEGWEFELRIVHPEVVEDGPDPDLTWDH